MIAERTNKVDLSSYDNSWYDTGAGALKRTLWYFVNALFFINPLVPLNSVKIMLLRLFGARIGKGVVIKPGVNVKYPWLLEIGNYVWVGENVWIDNLTQVRIGHHAVLSQGAMLLTGSHDYKTTTFDLQIGEITVEEGVWIGAKAIVCPHVVCGTHSVLSAASVATGNLEPYTIYQGNPAQAKRQRVIKG